MSQPSAPDKESTEWALTEHITTFANVAFERKLRPSRALYDAILSAKEDGYTDDEIRIVFWVARSVSVVGDELGGVAWLKNSLMNHGSLELVLRHKGRINPITGVAAKRWLDDLLSRIDETNPNVLYAILGQLPNDMRQDEMALFERMGVKYTRA